ncbi:probable leucine-rich repeat receptor-like serine/threonine-protein kinase [Tanacetum coccineum]
MEFPYQPPLTSIFIRNSTKAAVPLLWSRVQAGYMCRISGNSLSGKIPEFIGKWNNLDSLRIQASGLEGPIPSSITLLRTLTDLRISERNAAKEKQLAIENISAILRNLTSKQTLRVSRKIDEVSSQDNKMMLQDVSNMMQVSDDGKTEIFVMSISGGISPSRYNRSLEEKEPYVEAALQSPPAITRTTCLGPKDPQAQPPLDLFRSPVYPSLIHLETCTIPAKEHN